MKFLTYLLTLALILTSTLITSGCQAPDNGQSTLEPQGPIIIDEPTAEALCGPNDVINKLVAIPDSGAIGLTLGGNKYYPGTERMGIRTYGLGQYESDLARHGAALADFWSEGTRSFNTWTSSEGTVHITVDTTYWPACDANYEGGSDECWFAGTTCAAYRNTNVPGVRICEVWRIRLNIDSMYIYVDSREIPRENIVLAVAAHEVGHTMGLRHRNNTIMAPGVPIPGLGIRTWDNLPRFDACQINSLIDFTIDDSSEVIYLPTPEVCL